MWTLWKDEIGTTLEWWTRKLENTALLLKSAMRSMLLKWSMVWFESKMSPNLHHPINWQMDRSESKNVHNLGCQKLCTILAAQLIDSSLDLNLKHCIISDLVPSQLDLMDGHLKNSSPVAETILSRMGQAHHRPRTWRHCHACHDKIVVNACYLEENIHLQHVKIMDSVESLAGISDLFLLTWWAPILTPVL